MDKYEKYRKYLVIPFAYGLVTMMEDLNVSEIKSMEQLARFSTRYLRFSVARLNDTPQYVYFDRGEFHEDLEGNYIPYMVFAAFNKKGGDYTKLTGGESPDITLDIANDSNDNSLLLRYISEGCPGCIREETIPIESSDTQIEQIPEQGIEKSLGSKKVSRKSTRKHKSVQNITK